MNSKVAIGICALLSLEACSSMQGSWDSGTDVLAPTDRVDAGGDSGADVRDVASPVDVRVDAPSPIDVRVDVPTPMDVRVDVPIAIDAPIDSAADVRRDVATDVPGDTTTDTPTLDVATDVGTADAPRDVPATDGPASRTLACAPMFTWTGSGSSIGCNANFYAGFRFEIVASTPVRLTEIGLEAFLGSSVPGSLHASLVRLTGPSDQPDSANLTSSDVILHALVDFPGGPAATVQSVAVDAMVAPGWYAVVFGTGAFGATAISASVPSSGPGGCTLPGSSFPFSIRQSDGMFILQGATPHMFVRVVP